MRFRRKRLLGCFSSLVLIACVFCLLPFRLMLPGGYLPEHLSRGKDIVSITAIEDTYKVTISSHGRMLLLLTPEGPFPTWSAETTLVAIGDGSPAERDGLLLQKYTLGKDLIDEHDYFTSGNLWISEKDKILVLTVEYRKEYSHLLNHSATYRNVSIDRPTITPLTKDTKISELDGCYLRATGAFNDNGDHFLAAGQSLFTYSSYVHDKSAVYEIIAVVHVRDYEGKNRPAISIVSMKTVSPKRRK